MGVECANLPSRPLPAGWRVEIDNWGNTWEIPPGYKLSHASVYRYLARLIGNLFIILGLRKSKREVCWLERIFLAIDLFIAIFFFTILALFATLIYAFFSLFPPSIFVKSYLYQRWGLKGKKRGLLIFAKKLLVNVIGLLTTITLWVMIACFYWKIESFRMGFEVLFYEVFFCSLISFVAFIGTWANKDWD